MKAKRRKKIEEHTSNKLSQFTEEIKRLSLENDYPYISTHLNTALWKLKECIVNNEIYIADYDEFTM